MSAILDSVHEEKLEFENISLFKILSGTNQKNFLSIENIYKVSVNFVSEIVTCVKDKNNKIVEGDPEAPAAHGFLFLPAPPSPMLTA